MPTRRIDAFDRFLAQVEASGQSTVASRSCLLVPLPGDSNRGCCLLCDPSGERPVPLQALRPCLEERATTTDLRAKIYPRGLYRYMPQERNDAQQRILLAVCHEPCPFMRASKQGIRCTKTLGQCGKSSSDLFYERVADARWWCPIWLKQLGLIRMIREAQARVDAFVSRELRVQGREQEAGSRLSILDSGLPRGIVIVGGGKKYLPGTYVLLRMLRHRGCTLPVEVWHLGPREMPIEWGERLARYLGHGGAIRDAYQVADQVERDGLALRASPGLPIAATLHGYEAKLFALQWSRFAEVLLLDADNMPVRDPTFLFDEPAYRKTGAVFWPDSWQKKTVWYAIRRDTWRAFGIPDEEYREEREHETGQILVDRRRCWAALSLANWYMQNGRNFFFRYQLGDKDVPHMAWRQAVARLHRRGPLPPMAPRDRDMIGTNIVETSSPENPG
jgi:hypothetical protein